MNAAKNKSVDAPPLWIMRQAGRTLPEYRALREKYDFHTCMKTPELAAEITMQPINRFGFDAAVIFSDILVVPEAMGMKVSFSPLTLTPAIKTGADIKAIKPYDPAEKIGYVAEALKETRKRLGEERALLGFCGAPYTLACYMIEGASSKSFEKIKGFMFSNPREFGELMKILAEADAEYLEMQAEAGADAVQIFDTWAGELCESDFRAFVLPHLQELISRVKAKNIPIIYYINNIGNLLEAAKETGTDVIGLDWRVDMARARERLGKETSVQGNLDPLTLFAPAETIKKKVFELLDATGGKGHIVNLGHGLPPGVPLEGIETFVRAVRAWSGEMR